MEPRKRKIRVKLIARGQNSYPWRKQLPNDSDSWGDCQFIFDRNTPDYDYLVVIDDVSRKLMSPPETLACADENTLLVTTEPPTITRYGNRFCSQFHWVLTTHPKEILRHPNHIFSHTGNLWFNGHSHTELVGTSEMHKSDAISTVCSSKSQRHTLHAERLQFTEWLCQQLPDLKRYGHGFQLLKNKYTALDPFCFHLAIENFIGAHHWTEKFSDPILSHCVPIYYGCPNMDDYFPTEAYLKIDIHQRELALSQIRELISDPSNYQKRLPAVLEAKQLVLNDYNLMKMIHDHVCETFDSSNKASQRRLYGRKQIRLVNPVDCLSHCKWFINRIFN